MKNLAIPDLSNNISEYKQQFGIDQAEDNRDVLLPKI